MGPFWGEFGGPRDAARRFSLGPPGRKAPPFSRLRPPPRPPAALTDPACRARGETRAAVLPEIPGGLRRREWRAVFGGVQPAPRQFRPRGARLLGPNSPPTAGRRRPCRDFACREAAGKSVQYVAGFRKFPDFRKLPRISGNFRKFPEISGSFGKRPESGVPRAHPTCFRNRPHMPLHLLLGPTVPNTTLFRPAAECWCMFPPWKPKGRA